MPILSLEIVKFRTSGDTSTWSPNTNILLLMVPMQQEPKKITTHIIASLRPRALFTLIRFSLSIANYLVWDNLYILVTTTVTSG